MRSGWLHNATDAATDVTPEEAQQALDSRLAGATLREVAVELGFSVEGARRVVEREGRRRVDALHTQLVLMGAVELTIPVDGGPELELALAHLRWVVAELRQRGVTVRVYVRAGLDGISIGLQEAAPEEGR